MASRGGQSIRSPPPPSADFEKLITYAGTGQYASGGVSACALASLNFARVVLERESSGLRGGELLDALASKETIEDIVSVCGQWPQELHVEVETVLDVPIFKQSLKQAFCHYGVPDYQNFKKLLRELSRVSDSSKSSVAAITRPPEVIACARTPEDIFLVFDSHPRPDHANGSGLYICSGMDRAARYLHNLLHVDPRILADSSSSLQWQAQLLSNFSAHVFVAQPLVPAEVTRALLECSLEVLTLRTRVSHLETQSKSLTELNEELEDDMGNLKVEYRRLKREVEAARSPTSPNKQPGASNRFGRREELRIPSSDKGKGRADDVDDTAGFARQLQLDFESEQAQIAADRLLVQSLTQATFDCSVCLETLREDALARIPGCRHTTCRECLRQHVVTALGARRFPIPCPACVGDELKAEITQDVIFAIGIREKEYQIFEELQLSPHSVPVHCRGCKKSAFIDKSEYDTAKIIACPLPGCTYAWCKACQRRIKSTRPGDAPHSCDGSAELDHLIARRGWKRCPGCQTAIQKAEGCNHMSCPSPGCNTHFCYICGDKMTSSTARGEIDRAVSAHFRRQCELFEVPS